MGVNKETTKKRIIIYELVVYGAMSKKWPLRIFLLYFIFLAILPLQTLPYQKRVVGISLACMAAISNSKWPIYSFLQGSKNQNEKHVILFV